MSFSLVIRLSFKKLPKMDFEHNYQLMNCCDWRKGDADGRKERLIKWVSCIAFSINYMFKAMTKECTKKCLV